MQLSAPTDCHSHTTTLSMASTALGSKAIKVAVLAIGEDAIQNDDAANAAGRRAGALARVAGMSLETFWEALRPQGVATAHVAWCSMVDGWYDEMAESGDGLER